ncbi:MULTISPECIES: hypothetical protein [unclassified Mesorhizobium]|uniref:hypothetical protein n=1 Tax=unclassified Mesorhizobium TaxID=325217 RepID=UPI000FE60596|nr:MULTISPECIES: hypothetical protein [unclassified Mesorhizobium]RWI28175.1 MAG: hypothetical protein EOQ92_08595 [Mesorhizobium sp.]RWK51015.1 MAG: hypothetical protein EOR47_09470 [Mesorhizobium sp.]RWK96377.1 MAG: hypothetical protein EOR53_08640 [Mesorhizobium sp.]TIP56585.1 MAG: hypothetical protein E5X56_23845 [Mesorhizobium sp.]TIQ28237.1 MAG: hypothetical protein E5X54_18380 [Mesorhizobium sp.]
MNDLLLSLLPLSGSSALIADGRARANQDIWHIGAKPPLLARTTCSGIRLKRQRSTHLAIGGIPLIEF